MAPASLWKNYNLILFENEIRLTILKNLPIYNGPVLHKLAIVKKGICNEWRTRPGKQSDCCVIKHFDK